MTGLSLGSLIARSLVRFLAGGLSSVCVGSGAFCRGVAVCVFVFSLPCVETSGISWLVIVSMDVVAVSVLVVCVLFLDFARLLFDGRFAFDSCGCCFPLDDLAVVDSWLGDVFFCVAFLAFLVFE